MTRLEWRRDFSNQRYFLTDTLGLLSKQQTTATIGVVWWFGKKTAPGNPNQMQKLQAVHIRQTFSANGNSCIVHNSLGFIVGL